MTLTLLLLAISVAIAIAWIWRWLQYQRRYLDRLERCAVTKIRALDPPVPFPPPPPLVDQKKIQHGPQ